MSDQLFSGDPAKRRGSGWDTLGAPVDPFHSYQAYKFLYYPPKSTGKFYSVTREELIISHAFQWLHLMAPITENQRCLEASILLVAYFSMYDEETIKVTINSTADLTDLDIFGHKYHVVMGELEKVLCDRIFKELQVQVIRMIKVADRHQNPDPQTQLQHFLTLKKSYQSYIDFRNDDGIFQGVFYCVLSIMNESGADATDDLVAKLVEATVLIHDSNNVIRHFMENDVASLYRYVSGDLKSSLSTAYKKAAGLYYQIRVDPAIRSPLKLAACSYIKAIYTFNAACHRYGYGTQLVEMTSHCFGKITTLPGAHIVRPDRGIIMEEILNDTERADQRTIRSYRLLRFYRFWRADGLILVVFMVFMYLASLV